MIGMDSYPLNRYLMDQARGRRRDHQPFTCQGAVTYSTATDQVIAIDMDSDAPFLWSRLYGDVISVATGIVGQAPDIRLMVRYGGPGGRAWAQQPVHWNCVVGYRSVPYILPFPKLLNAGSRLHVTLNIDTLGAGAPFTARLSFGGAKLFRWRAA